MSDLYIECGECDFGSYSKEDLIKHVLATHSGYTPEEALSYVTEWEVDALERQEVDNIYRGDFYNKHGYDPDDLPCDQDDF